MNRLNSGHLVVSDLMMRGIWERIVLFEQAVFERKFSQKYRRARSPL